MTDLKRLNEMSEYRVSTEDPDPRGWRVAASDGRDVGLVRDLVVDTEAMKARYLDVEVDRTLNPSGSDRHVLVPTDAVAIGDTERQQRRVTIGAPSSSVLNAARPYDERSDMAARSAEWPSAGSHACNVRVTRGGGNG